MRTVDKIAPFKTNTLGVSVALIKKPVFALQIN